MSKFIDLTGKKFGKWTVIDRAPNRGEKTYWNCQCKCGQQSEILATDLRNKKSTKCQKCKVKTHGMSNTSVFGIWFGMKERCSNPKRKEYKNYGGRGITVCNRWMKFEKFYADMGDRPKGMWIDRIDNDGNYEPNNCRWATPTVNNNNRRCSKKAV